MILASSSGDHFDCFFAGDSEGLSDSRLEGLVVAAGVEPAVVLLVEGTEAGLEIAAGDDEDRLPSSSLGLSNCEISTVMGCKRRTQEEVWSERNRGAQSMNTEE